MLFKKYYKLHKKLVFKVLLSEIKFSTNKKLKIIKITC